MEAERFLELIAKPLSQTSKMSLIQEEQVQQGYRQQVVGMFALEQANPTLMMIIRQLQPKL